MARLKLDRDAFEEWRAHPISEHLFRMMDVEAARLRERWTSLSFDDGACDALALARMRERAGLLRELRDITAETIEDVINADE